jgi:type VI secretion system (T6SS) effector TldE1-like protein
MVAAWMANSSLRTASATLTGNADRTTFEDRFVAPAVSGAAALQPLKRYVMARAEPELSTAQEALATRWMPDGFRPAISDDGPRAIDRAIEAKPAVATAAGIPLPRSRPAAAVQPAQTSQALALATASIPTTPIESPPPQQPAERSVFQKLSDMVKTKVAVASIGLGKAPDLAALGYDNETAVYDITAHAVYLPNGMVMEAHSGMGSLRDDPDHVSMRMVGATPPAVYSLKPREKDFHGVAALRMTPADGSDIGGRSGLLVHSYMLGPNGDSNGCISVRDFDRFRKAYDDGQFTRIAVVNSVKAMILAQQNAD